MGLRSAEQFFAGLRDAREVYYRGQRVHSVLDHPELGVAARHAAIDFRLAENPVYSELAVHHDGGEEYSAYYRIPRDANDLLSRSKLIQAGTAEGATLVLLIKEIGTDALFALKRILGRSGDAQGIQRVQAFYRHCRDNDLAIAVAQTDVKGDRSKRPSDQRDPDMYLRVVEKRADGIVVSGAKVHTSCTPMLMK
jgi:4-hydroxybutyryl-CoA dehydratase/vinylacetyl-CoA-Delta-isomerase